MQNMPWLGRNFWLNAGLGLAVAGMPWTATLSLLGTSTIATLIATPVQAAMLSGWEFDSSTQELIVTVPGGTTPRYFLAAEPARIVLDLPDTEVGTVPLQQAYGGAVREIRVAQFAPGVTRIVLELAPGTVLAPGHVELQQVAGADQQGDRWMLRPLLATNASVAMSTPPAASTAFPPTTTPAVPTVPESTAPPTSPSSLPTATEATPTTAVELPPLEPGATEIPVELPPETAATLPTPDTTASPPPIIGMDTDIAGTEAANTEVTTPAVEASPTPAETAQVTVPALPANEPTAASTATIETDSPRSTETNPAETGSNETSPAESIRMPFVETAQSETAQSETATIPEPSTTENAPESAIAPGVPIPEDTNPDEDANSENINSEDTNPEAVSSPNPPAPTMATSPALPEASPSAFAASNPESVSVPPLDAEQAVPQSSSPPLTPTRPQASPAIRTAAIEFGQPLPKSALNNLPPIVSGNSIASTNRHNPILLPSGTILNLRYTGETPLELAAGEPRQEVLVVAEAVRDEAGNIVLPEGSYVMGRFETGETGSQFIAQAISLQGQSLMLNAQSEPLSGQHPSQGGLLRNSALGVAAGVALGLTGIGLIPAIAVGAATTAGITFLPESHSNVVQPDQVLEVRLTQDLTQVN